MNPVQTYVGRFPAWSEALCAYLDYVWLVAMLGWSFVLITWWHGSRRNMLADFGWTPWVAGAGFASALIVLFSISMPSIAMFDGRPPPGIVSDIGLGFAFLAALGGSWWSRVAREGPHARRLVSVLVLVLAIAGVWRREAEAGQDSALLLACCGVLTVAPWWRHPQAGAACRLALAVVALLPTFSTVGPLAAWVPFGTQRWSPVSPLSLVAGCFHACVALAVFFVLFRELRGEVRDDATSDPKNRRAFVLAAIAWLAGGGVWTATAEGNGSRARYAASLRLCASRLDAALLESALGPELRLQPRDLPLRSGSVMHSAHLAAPTHAPLSASLATSVRGFESLAFWLRLVTLRDDWLIVALSSPPPVAAMPALPVGDVVLARRAHESDRAAWRSKTGALEGPRLGEFGTTFLQREPLLSRDGRMLGWIEFAIRGNANLVPFEARLTPLLTAVLGVAVLALFYLHHRNARWREAALRATAVAAESARAKALFVAQVSHELRTPLQSLLGYAELLQREAGTSTATRGLTGLREEARALLANLQSLLAEHAGEAHAPPRGPLPAVCGDAVERTLPSLAGLRVLIADDNLLVRELFAACVRECGGACAVMEDGEAALACALADPPDALVLDLAMPRGDGFSITRALRAHPVGRGLRIIGVSAHAGHADRERALAAGMDAFLAKPVELADLVTALAEARVTRSAAP